MTTHPNSTKATDSRDPFSTAAVNDMLAAFRKYGGPAGLQLDKEGTCCLQDGADRIISIIHRNGAASLVVIAPIALRHSPTPDLLKMLLKSNSRWDATSGGMFAVTASDTPLQFFSRVNLTDLSAQSFIERIRSFSNLVQNIESQVRAFDAAVYEERHAKRH